MSELKSMCSIGRFWLRGCGISVTSHIPESLQSVKELQRLWESPKVKAIFLIQKVENLIINGSSEWQAISPPISQIILHLY